MVHDHSHGDPVSRNPRPEETGYHSGGGDVVEFDDLQQPGVPIDHRQQVAEPLRGEQNPHDIEVHRR